LAKTRQPRSDLPESSSEPAERRQTADGTFPLAEQQPVRSRRAAAGPSGI